jgi:hypothetical protein
MASGRRRLVSLVSMAAFLLANSPASAIAIRCPWVCGTAYPSQKAPQETACATACPCCCQDVATETAPTQPSQLFEDESRTRPACPSAPSCPYGCCWCSVAKVPCCVGYFELCSTLLPCLGARLSESALLIPSAPPQELTHPPRD